MLLLTISHPGGIAHKHSKGKRLVSELTLRQILTVTLGPVHTNPDKFENG